MDIVPAPNTGEIGLLISSLATKDDSYEAILKLTAALALQGSVCILDCGNCFDLFPIARYVRRHTHRLTETLDRITIARAFTCYQVISLLQQKGQNSSQPKIITNLLDTFYDENVTLTESHRLLKIALHRLKELSQQAPILITLRPPLQPERATLVTAVHNIADHLLIFERPPSYQPRPLF